MTSTVFAFGASGKFAGPVVPALVARGVMVRTFDAAVCELAEWSEA